MTANQCSGQYPGRSADRARGAFAQSLRRADTVAAPTTDAAKNMMHTGKVQSVNFTTTGSFLAPMLSHAFIKYTPFSYQLTNSEAD